MAALTGPRIAELVVRGTIVIDPFDPSRVNPNSYNLEISDEVVMYRKGANVHDVYEDWWVRKGQFQSFPSPPPIMAEPLSKSKEEPTVTRRLANPIEPPVREEGIVRRFWPGVLYLLRTKEYTETSYPYRPQIDGRSSLGRLGEFVHVTAGYGDVNFKGTWTLEVAVVQPVEVQYPLQSCQISYTRVEGPQKNYESPKYQGQRAPQPSRLWKEIQRASETNVQDRPVLPPQNGEG